MESCDIGLILMDSSNPPVSASHVATRLLLTCCPWLSDF